MSFAHLKFWKTSKYAERVFDAEDKIHETIIEQPLANGWIMLSCSSSPASASDSSDYLTQDPMHDVGKDESLKPTGSHVSLSRSINSVALDALKIGEVTVDDEGTEWVVRECFCDNVGCPGKAFWRVDGKDELDFWDRGKPILDE
jgi:hypothetical protein